MSIDSKNAFNCEPPAFNSGHILKAIGRPSSSHSRQHLYELELFPQICLVFELGMFLDELQDLDQTFELLSHKLEFYFI